MTDYINTQKLSEKQLHILALILHCYNQLIFRNKYVILLI